MDRLTSMKKKVNNPEDQFGIDIQMKQFLEPGGEVG